MNLLLFHELDFGLVIVWTVNHVAGNHSYVAYSNCFCMQEKEGQVFVACLFDCIVNTKFFYI